MDIISHALLGAAVVADEKLLWPALFFGAAPDILNGIPTHLAMMRRKKKEGMSFGRILKSFFSPEQWEGAPSWMHTIYGYTHSLLLALAIYIFLWVVYPPWIILMKAWLLHLAIDFLTHRDWFAVRLLHPFSDWQAGLFNWFETPLKYLGIIISIPIFALVYFV